MQLPHYSEFIGITPETAALIEAHRQAVDETKDAILRRVLSPKKDGKQRPNSPLTQYLDLGQGARVRVGENLYLYLNEEAKKKNMPDCVAIARAEGLEIDGKLIPSSRGSYLHPAMVQIQKQKHHYNEIGKVVSLSAWRQWYVLRKDRLVRLYELKDPALARTRGRQFSLNTLDDL